MPEFISGMSRALCGRAVLVLAACLLSGCAASRFPLAPADVMQGRQVLLKVPFFPDNTDQCGPSALASVLGYWEKPETPARLREEIYRAHLKGSLTIDLLLAAGSRGLSAEMINGSLARVKAELDAGRPLIAFVNSGFRFYPVGHYLVITGYDDRRKCIFAHSGTKRDQRISYRKFDKQWEKTERWALLILPPQP
ncbi:MAG: C39 family peptidase [Elusimicrobiota bacterium]|nr:C39 family peptidase [Elusimicrobiota bacterium]